MEKYILINGYNEITDEFDTLDALHEYVKDNIDEFEFTNTETDWGVYKKIETLAITALPVFKPVEDEVVQVTKNNKKGK